MDDHELCGIDHVCIRLSTEHVVDIVHFDDLWMIMSCEVLIMCGPGTYWLCTEDVVYMSMSCAVLITGGSGTWLCIEHVVDICSF